MVCSGFLGTTQKHCCFKYDKLRFKCDFRTIKFIGSFKRKCLIQEKQYGFYAFQFLSAQTLGLLNFRALSLSAFSHWEILSMGAWPLSSYSGAPVGCRKDQHSYDTMW